ncbi:MAG TPA: cyclic lactone autoinducer peptide [Halanaerobiaceae bacterium]|jgi:cyclic lactone autoinducer peptide|nr:cyclic lactone autoinducer peptide [Bacillota bacterium]HHU92715.1 cyclic lactone autoinducer peptide [Halanaerobiaceae bacterium]HOA39828.1 cyclic lactone autoinducer peptide [Halanaerobiales bacterium]HPZ62616.1 cyclic lactone autoinducer peptide [Halanaerobiales bacterium]HQD03885.1 cyclic lactone autoinducer peptide [Halanaerobiales bacterium]
MLKRLVNLFIKTAKNSLSSNCLCFFYQPTVPEELKK